MVWLWSVGMQIMAVKYVFTRMPVGGENEYNIIYFCLEGPACDVLRETAKGSGQVSDIV